MNEQERWIEEFKEAVTFHRLQNTLLLGQTTIFSVANAGIVILWATITLIIFMHFLFYQCYLLLSTTRSVGITIKKRIDLKTRRINLQEGLGK